MSVYKTEKMGRNLAARQSLQLTKRAPPGAFFPLSEAERYRLVEAAKSQTEPFLVTEASKQAFFSRQYMDRPKPLAAIADGPFSDIRQRDDKQIATDKFNEQYCNEVGSKTIIQFREWSDEWRVMTRVDGTVGTPPPLQSGDRTSCILSDRAARKIADSSAYMASKGTGYTTFVTGTFDQSARDRIANNKTTIQREVTRTMDALKKMYQRGWTTDNTGKRLDGHSEPLAYCWVVEIPMNDNGEINPHVHIMMEWSVDYEDFQPWRKRIESIWGNGYFHLEKIKDPLCAGAYMAKAAGYLSKANGQTDQGEVTGNRYAISKAARAPEWYTIGEYEMGIMGSLIREVYDSITDKHAALFYERKRLNLARETIRVQAKTAQEKNSGKYPLRAKQKLQQIGQSLMAVRQKINALPVRATKYQLILKGSATFNWFMGWSKAGGWSPNDRPDSHWLHRLKQRIYLRKRQRDAWRDYEIVEQLEEREKYKDESLSVYDNYLEYLEC
jgi:hypothetical protein